MKHTNSKCQYYVPVTVTVQFRRAIEKRWSLLPKKYGFIYHQTYEIKLGSAMSMHWLSQSEATNPIHMTHDQYGRDLSIKDHTNRCHGGDGLHTPLDIYIKRIIAESHNGRNVLEIGNGIIINWGPKSNMTIMIKGYHIVQRQALLGQDRNKTNKDWCIFCGIKLTYF